MLKLRTLENPTIAARYVYNGPRLHSSKNGVAAVHRAHPNTRDHGTRVAGFYVAEDALLREIEVRHPERYPERGISPAGALERAPSSTVASSDDGDPEHRSAPSAAPVGKSSAGAARRKAASRLVKNSSAGNGLNEAAPREIRLAEPIRSVKL